MKKNKLLGIAVIMLLVLTMSASAIDWTPFGNINLKDALNITNISLASGETANFSTYFGNGAFLENITIPTGSLNMSNNTITEVRDIQFVVDGFTPSHSEGLLFYNDERKTLAFHNNENDITVNINQEILVRGRNKFGEQINNGQVVLVSGSSGQNPTFGLARADSPGNLDGLIGLATHDISNNGFGFVTLVGIIDNVDTSAFTANDTLYISSTEFGNVTNVAPTAPNFPVKIGTVLNSNAETGNIHINVVPVDATNSMVINSLTVNNNLVVTGNTTSSMFFGIYDWVVETVSQLYLSFNGTSLEFNETKLNATIDSRASVMNSNCNASGTCSSGGVAYMDIPNQGNLNVTGNFSALGGDVSLVVEGTSHILRSRGIPGNLFIQTMNAPSDIVFAPGGGDVVVGTTGSEGIQQVANDWNLEGSNGGLQLAADVPIVWSNSTLFSTGKDVGLIRGAPGVLNVTNGTTGTGNISADFYLGDGSLLTGIDDTNCNASGTCSTGGVTYLDLDPNNGNLFLNNTDSNGLNLERATLGGFVGFKAHTRRGQTSYVTWANHTTGARYMSYYMSTIKPTSADTSLAFTDYAELSYDPNSTFGFGKAMILNTDADVIALTDVSAVNTLVFNTSSGDTVVSGNIFANAFEQVCTAQNGLCNDSIWTNDSGTAQFIGNVNLTDNLFIGQNITFASQGIISTASGGLNLTPAGNLDLDPSSGLIFVPNGVSLRSGQNDWNLDGGDNGGLELASDNALAWSSTTSSTGTKDVGLVRGAANLLNVTNGGSGPGNLSVECIIFSNGFEICGS